MNEPATIHEALDNPAFDLHRYLEEKVFKEFNHNLWESIENIMRKHIDNPLRVS